MRKILLVMAVICASPLVPTGAVADDSQYQYTCNFNRQVQSSSGVNRCVFQCTDGTDRFTDHAINQCPGGFSLKHDGSVEVH